MPGARGSKKTLHAGRFLHLVEVGGWEFVERVGHTGIVVVVAVTEDLRLVLTEQLRIPVGRPVIELPAGLAGDAPGALAEDFREAAKRELLEETGYEARTMEHLIDGPPSPGLASEVLTFYLARGLRKSGEGGGVDGEAITVHEVPIAAVPAWLRAQEKRGALVDPKVYTGLYFTSGAAGPPR